MIPVTAYADHTVGVLGLGRTGFSAAHALRAGGARVVVWDDGGAADSVLAQAKDLGFEVCDLTGGDWPELAALIVSPGIAHLYPEPHSVITRAWGEGVPVDNDIGLFFANQGRAGRVIAVTGTNGKSTTTALIGHVLNAAGYDAQIGGNIGRPVLDLEPPSPDGFLVLELSSYQTDLARALNPDIAVFLNLSPDHLDRHGGMGGYFAAKQRLFEPAPGLSVIGVDEAEGRFLANRLRAGRTPGDAVVAISATRKLGGRGLSVSARDQVLVVLRDGVDVGRADISRARALRGAHNRQNAVAALAVCSAVGITADEFARHAETFPGLAHRMEQVGRIGPVLLVNDSKATNAQAAARALASFDDIFLIAGGRAKEDGLDALEPFLPRVRHAFLIGEAADAFAVQLAGKVEISVSKTLDRAVADAADAARASSSAEPVVLLSPACASFDQFTSFEERGSRFTEFARKLPGFESLQESR